MQKEFSREIAALADVFDFVGAFIKSNDVGEGPAFSTNLAVEELFTNMVKYNPEGNSDITIEIEIDDGKLFVRLTDYDVAPFDPTKPRDVDVNQPLEDRRIGGLGLHLVRNIVDKISFEYKNRNVYITLMKKLEA